MNLWLDDVRPAPEGWHWATTARDAIAFLHAESRSGQKIEAVSLDHDLGASPDDGIYARGNSEECGCLVVDYIGVEQIDIGTPIRIHSWNVVEGPKMVGKLQQYGYAAYYSPYRCRTACSACKVT